MMDLRKDGNKAEEIKECKTNRHLLKYTADVGYSSCIFSFLPCFCPSPGPSLTEMKFYRNFSTLVRLIFRGLLHLQDYAYFAGDELLLCRG